MRSKLLQKLFIGSMLSTVAAPIQATNASMVHKSGAPRGRYFGSLKAMSTYKRSRTSTKIRKVKFFPVMNGKNRLGKKPPLATIKGIKGIIRRPPSKPHLSHGVYCIPDTIHKNQARGN